MEGQPQQDLGGTLRETYFSPPTDSFEGLKYQLDPQEILMFIENDLRGKSFDLETGKYVTIGLQLMNEYGIRTIMSIVRTHVNKIAFMSNLTEKQIEIIMKILHFRIAELLAASQYEYGIAKTTHMYIIQEKITNIIWLSLLKALNEGERNYFKQTTRILENKPAQQKPRWQIWK